jgi:7-cyano-7-deazaguanine synthase in queuosine biosynthesis
MSEVLLFSAGLDSFPAWHCVGKPPALYFDLVHRYSRQELAAVNALAARCDIDVTISEELDLSAWEAHNAIIPMRNVYLAMLAANHADTIWCIGVKGDRTADKSPAAFERISQFVSEFTGRAVRVKSPFWDMTKTQVVGWYRGEGLPVADLLLTFSCSRSDGGDVHCGRCSSCLRRWISLANNGIEAPFEARPWEWSRVNEYYIPAMRDGTYPSHRSAEFFAALATVGIWQGGMPTTPDPVANHHQARTERRRG